MADRVSLAALQLPTRPHALYRFFDQTDVLLYVGISVNLPARLAQHRRAKDWWLEIASITVEYFPTRRAAVEAERDAIKNEKPLHNDQHNEMVVVPAGVLEEPCGEECDPDCRNHHGDRWACIGRDSFACDVISAVTAQHGDEWMREAAERACRDLALPQGHRTWPAESNEATIVAYELVEHLIHEVARYQYVATQLLKEVPPWIADEIRAAARHDWACAGEPDKPFEDMLPDVIRHLGHLIAQRAEVAP